MKDIKDYLHLYRGSDAQVIKGMWKGTIGTLRGVDTESSFLERCSSNFTPDEEFYTHGRVFSNDEFKLLLRPLSDMTEEEKKAMIGEPDATGRYVDEMLEIKMKFFNAERFRYLLSKGFDLFGLIEDGLALDKTKQSSTI